MFCFGTEFRYISNGLLLVCGDANDENEKEFDTTTANDENEKESDTTTPVPKTTMPVPETKTLVPGTITPMPETTTGMLIVIF